MDLVIAPSNMNLRWNDSDYVVVKAGISGGAAYAEVSPRSDELEEELRSHIQRNMAMKVFIRSGYIELIGKN